MELTAALAADLATLTEALDDSGLDLEDGLRRLAANASLAVPSYLGLSLLIDVDGHRVALTTTGGIIAAGDVRASIGLLLQPGRADGAAVRPAVLVVLYAAAPGAFVPLAADLLVLTERTGEDFAVDQHLSFVESTGLSVALSDLSTVNQAIGVLIGQEGTVEQAEHALHLLANSSSLGVGAATALLAALDARTRTRRDPTADG
jgi:hypothetical protein